MDCLLSILNAAWMIIFIVFFFGFCIFIHEFGHMIVGLWCSLEVEKFSIGFGKKLWGFTWKGIEFAISLLPFGGYVALPQIDIAEPQVRNGKPLPYAKPASRAITAFAGPLFNILFGFFLATIMWICGLWVSAPSSSVVITSIPQSLPLYSKESVQLDDKIIAFNGEPTTKFLEEICEDLPGDGTEYKITVKRGDETIDVPFTPKPNPEWVAGLRKGDLIIKVNGHRFTKGFEEMRELYVYNENADIDLEVLRGSERLEFKYIAEPNPLWEDLGLPFFHCSNPLTVGTVVADSPADKLGIKAGDQILQIDGVNVTGGQDFLAKLEALDEKPFSLMVSRGEENFTTEEIVFTDDAKQFGIFFNVVISTILPGKPAELAGLKEGDIILECNDEMVFDSKELTSRIRSSNGTPVNLTIQRGNQKLMIANITPEKTDLGDGEYAYLVGMMLNEQMPKVIGHPNPWKQFTKICAQTGKTLKLLFTPVTSKITGKAQGKAGIKLQNMSGPAGIITMLWFSLKNEGIRGGLGLIILITFSLALVNLLPLPVLDGGHIMFAFIEMIIRRRLPVKFISILQNIFAVLLIMIFLYITFFDGKRIVKLTKTVISAQQK